MSDSVQDVYAKNLPTEFGYPLRTPEPSSNLPESYQESGLQIGDVGYVDRYGGFHVLFNIRYSSDHVLHRKHHLPPGFEPIKFNDEEIDINREAISSGQFIGSPHISHKPPEQPDERLLYRFVPSSPSGAILILPFGAVRHELGVNEIENFRKVAVKHAQSWCAEAGRDSVYLITGFHKARSWSLGSFRNAPHDAEILVKQPKEQDGHARIHKWEPTFSMYWRTGPGCENDSLNQTVFITGFKITVRWWLCIPDVELLQRSPNAWFAFFRLSMLFLLGILNTLWERISLKRHEHVPQLSPPFHPSDVVNRYLLAKNPNANVAVTHDRQWMSVLKMEELIHDGVVNDDYVWEILSDKYISVSDNDTVWLERKSSGDANKPAKVASGLEGSALSSNENTFVAVSGDANASCPKHNVFSFRSPSIDNPWIVISHIRADNVIAGLSRLPVGFYVDLEFNGVRRRTSVRSIPVCESVIEWDDEFLLSNDPSVRVQLSFCAAFEFEPMLGNGVTLCTADITVGDLVGSTSLINFSSGAKERCSSLLITVERRYCPYYQAYSSSEHRNLNREMSSVTAHETSIGRDALLRYYEDYRDEDLEKAISHFECALRICHPDDECRPAALFNLAMVKLHRFEASGADTAIAESIALYREALEMRPASHPDRPATLLGLCRALLYRYRRQGQAESHSDELKKLMDEVKKTCTEGSHERRAAILVLQTYKRIRVVSHGTLSEIDDLIAELDAAARVPPGDYFDRHYRLQNLGCALKGRFKMQGNRGLLRDLDQAIAKQEDALQLVPDRCPVRVSHLNRLGVSLWIRFNKLGDIRDLERAIAMQGEATELTPKDHANRAQRLQDLGWFLGARFRKLGDIKDIERAIENEEEAVEVTPKDHPDHTERLQNLAMSLSIRFVELGHLNDLERAVVMKEEIVEVTPKDHPDRAQRLQNLGVLLRARFDKLRDIKDIERAIEVEGEAVRLTPENHPDRAQRLQRLGWLLGARFSKLRDIKDIERSIEIEEKAVEVTPKDHPDRAQRLQSLGVLLRARFYKLRNIKDIGRAIEMEEEVVRLTPEDHPDRAQRLQNLGVSLRARFDERGNIKDIVRAIEVEEEAVDVTPKDHPDRAQRLQNLGGSLKACFNECRDIKNIGRAIEVEGEALEITPKDHPNRARRLQNLARSLYIRFKKFKHIEDLEEAVVLNGEAKRLTSNDRQNRVQRL